MKRPPFFRVVPLFLAITFPLASAFGGATPDTETRCVPSTIGKRTYWLELATTPETRTQGLMNRDTIGPCDGMAFFFPTIAPQKFWMKNTRIPLDMLFVDAQQTIVAIINATAFSEVPVGPEAPVASVIEIDGGRAKRENIQVGDKVHYELAVPPHRLAH